LHEEIFNLCYYSQGAFNQSIVYNLPIYLRRFYAKKLLDIKTKESEQIKEQQNKSKQSARSSGPRSKSSFR